MTPGIFPGNFPGTIPTPIAGPNHTLAGPQTVNPNERPASRQARQLTGRPYLSHSQLAAFRACPRRFAFQYVENAPPDFQASSLLFGAAMHAAFETHFRRQLEGRTTSAGDLAEAFQAAWRDQRAQVDEKLPIRFCKGEDLDAVTALAQRVIEAFLASAVSQPGGLILGVEEQFQVTLDPDLPDVLARVDLVTQTADSLHVVDLKTSRSRWSVERAAEAAEQLLLYGRTIAGLAEELGLPVKLHFVVLTKAKKPVVQVLDIPADEARIRAVRESVAQVWQSLRGGNFYANPSPLNCAICPFHSRCPAFAGQ